MKNISILIFCMLFSAGVYAQSSKLQGYIFDAETYTPLAGARISVDGSFSTTSSKEGVFKILCPAGKRLQVDLSGYLSFSTLIGSCEEDLEIALMRDIDQLPEVRLSGRSARLDLQEPLAVVRLKQAQLQRGTGLFLDDAINEQVPGVTMNRRAVSSGQQFNIRGYGNGVGFKGASNNFDGQGYKVYLNNMPVTDAEGVTLLDDIDFASLGSVEVIKGPAGARYGMAIAGVVNLQTRRPATGTTRIGQKVSFGEYGLLRLSSSLETATDHISLLANYGHQVSDGFMAHSASEKDFANLMLDFRPRDRQQVSMYLGYANSYDQRGGN